MKLVIATPLYPPESGGPATYASILTELLPRESVDVFLVKFSDVRHLPRGIRHVAYFKNVFSVARKADAVLVLDPVSTGLPAALAAMLARKPYVVKVVGDYAWEQGTQRFGIKETLDEFVKRKWVPLQVSLLRSIQSFVTKSARKVIVPSNYLKGIVNAWNVHPQKISVIYNAMQEVAPGTLPHSVMNLPRPHIVSVGRLVPWKHMDGVIDAVAGLKKGTLIIVGSGPEHDNLVEHAVKVLPSAVFTGALSRPDALAVIQDADVFVLNSSYEGLSHLLIEAVSLGVPVVATNVGGNGEVIEHESEGVLVSSGDTLELVRAIEGVLSRRKKTKPQAAMLKYAPRTMVTATATLLKSLV